MLSSNDEFFFKEIDAVIEKAKKTMKRLYQLCFIATSENPLKDEAVQLIEKMIEKGYVTRGEVLKAMEDVQRWRRIFLDRLSKRYAEEILG